MYKNYYFLGIGGIGMSALARYFHAKGFQVAGYDRTATQLTGELEAEGIAIHYDDSVAQIPELYLHKEETVIIYTPAIPKDHSEYCYFVDQGYTLFKRAQLLGQVTRHERALCIAGTHGKTTTSTMTAHLLKQSHVDCNAFLGGIAKNYTNNLLLSDKSDLVVIEADEYDRSFHTLLPYMAVVTATDPDHLDIYGNEENYLESFAHFTELIQPGGALIMKKGVKLQPRLQEGVTLYSYSGSESADFCATNIRIGGGEILFDFVTPDATICDVQLGVPVTVNIENGVAAMAIGWLNGMSAEELKAGMASFAGIRRRFETHLKTDRVCMIDDYAHHPEELTASISSVKALYSDKKVLGVFQPHLYSRTNDFYREFAQALSMLDEVILLDIYPARELPMPGVSSQMIFDLITTPAKTLCTKQELLGILPDKHFDVLLTLGAGDIDAYIPQIVEQLKRR